MTSLPHDHRTARRVKYILVFLGIVLVVLFAFLWRDYRLLRRAQIAGAREARFSAFIKRHEPLTANEAGFIRQWMTFDYINKIFGLPSDYVKTQLQITDSRYPRISLSGYARNQHIDVATLLNSVADAVRNYLITK